MRRPKSRLSEGGAPKRHRGYTVTAGNRAWEACVTLIGCGFMDWELQENYDGQDGPPWGVVTIERQEQKLFLVGC